MVDAVQNTGGAGEDEWKRTDNLFKSVTSISRQLMEVLMAYLTKIVGRHLGDVHAAPTLRLNAPKLTQLWLPFFTS
jgi:hypothetical protein